MFESGFIIELKLKFSKGILFEKHFIYFVAKVGLEPIYYNKRLHRSLRGGTYWLGLQIQSRKIECSS